METIIKEKAIKMGELQDYIRELINKGIVSEGTCSTAADTAAKTVTLGTTFKFESKATFLITFSNAITVANATLAVTHTDSEGITTTETAKPIYYRGAALPAGKVSAGDNLILRYDGTSYNVIGTLAQDFTETDPIFSASAAAGITSGDIDNWNSKTSNVGTITGITMNGSSKGTSGVVDLGTVLTSHQDISGKADKSETVSSVAYDTTGKKITKTINGTTTDVVSASSIVTDGGGLKSHQSVTDHNPTLSWGNKSKVATVGSTEINVTMPQNPNINTTYKLTIGSTTKGDTANGVDLGTLKSESASSGGSTLSLVTTGEKHAWNAKQDALEFNTTYDASTNKAATMADVPTAMSASGTNHKGGLVPDPGATQGTTKFLREDGSWQVPAYPTIEDFHEAVATLQSAPTSSTLTYQRDGQTYNYKIGDEVRVPDQDADEGYKFYKLYDITGTAPNQEAVWGGLGSGGGSVTITGTITVNLEEYINNSKTAGSGLVGVVITLTNTSDSETVGTHTIVSGETGYTFSDLTPMKNYSVSVSAVTGYTQPEAQTVSELGIGTSVTKTFQYEADEYTVAITSDQGASDPAISEAVVTINGTDYENGDTIKFATGTSQSDIESAISTTTISRYNNAVTVNTTNKTITSAYTYVPLGNFIFERKGGLYTAAQWTTALNNGKVSNDDVIGIVVNTEEHKLMISLDSLETKQVYNSQTAAAGMTGINDPTIARARFAGEADTLLMMNTYGADSTYAAGAARNYTFGNGSKGYLPSLGEFKLASSNKSTIDALITACNKTAIDTSTLHWTSTYYGVYSSIFYSFWLINWETGNDTTYTVDGNYNVRPFTQWKPISTRLHFTATDNNSVAGMILEITDQGGNSIYVKTGSDGDCYLSLDNGTYTINSFSHSLSVNSFTVSNYTTVNISATKIEYVDLGLSSGVKWATCNLGASSPTESGDYFSWGNIIGHGSSDNVNIDDGYIFSWDNYQSTSGKQLVADIASNDSTHDAALAIKGSPWRMPTKNELTELSNDTDKEFVSIMGVRGWKFMKKTEHNICIFMPLTGQGSTGDSTVKDYNVYGYYLSSSYVNESNCTYMGIRTDTVIPNYDYRRYLGLCIRPVQ